MNFWNKYQWTVVGIAGTIVIHLILLLFLNFKTLPEVVATNEVLIDFAEEIKPTTDDLQEVQEAGEDGRPLTNVAADVNSETQMSSRIDKEKLSGEVDKLVQELESQYRNEATRSQEALEKLEKQREERQNKNSLYDESAEDVEAMFRVKKAFELVLNGLCQSEKTLICQRLPMFVRGRGRSIFQ